MSIQHQKINEKTEQQALVLMLAPYVYNGITYEKDQKYLVDFSLAKLMFKQNIATLSIHSARYQNKMLKINYEEI